MIHISPDKLIFAKNIIGIFSTENIAALPLCEYEYVCEPPYKACVVVIEGKNSTCKAYFTSLSVRTLLSRLQNHAVKS